MPGPLLTSQRMSYFRYWPTGTVQTMGIFLIMLSAFSSFDGPRFCVCWPGAPVHISLMGSSVFCFVYLFALGFRVLKHRIRLGDKFALVLSDEAFTWQG